MPKTGDAVKREQWRRRLEQFETRGQSIAEFCREEGVGTHTFYYWRKQLGHTSQTSRSVRRGRTGRPSERTADEPATRERRAAKPEPVPTGESVIHFTWDSRLSFSVPADCLDAIRCVLEYANHTRAAASDAGPLSASFRQVIVS